MYSSLDRIDILIKSALGPTAVQTDHRGADEIVEQLELSTVFALTRAIKALRLKDPDIQAVLFAHIEPPPEALVDVLRAVGAGIDLQDQERLLQPGTFDVDAVNAIVHDTFRALGREVLRREGLTATVDDLRAFEARILEQHPHRDAEEDEITWWTLVVELAAVTGEVLMREVDARWAVVDADGPTADMASLPFSIQRDQLQTNVLGKAERFLEHGATQAPSHMIAGIHETPDEGPPMFKLVPSDWGNLEHVRSEPLLKGEGDIPHIAYGVDMPNSFAYAPASDDDDLEAKREACLKTLRTMPVEVNTLGDILHIVHDNYYASEMLLDPQFMQQWHDKLGAPLLTAAVPTRGLLAIVDGSNPNYVGALMQFVEMTRNDASADQHLSTELFGVFDGQVQALVRFRAADEDEDDSPAEAAPEPAAEAPVTAPTEPAAEEPEDEPEPPKKGFFARLFGW
jgi:hypothetical protein